MMDTMTQNKIAAAIANGRVLKTTDNDLMFYHVVDRIGRDIVQITAPYSGYGAYEVVYNARRVLYVNWRPEYDLIDAATVLAPDRRYIVDLVRTCDRKIQKQIQMYQTSARTR